MVAKQAAEECIQYESTQQLKICRSQLCGYRVQLYIFKQYRKAREWKTQISRW